MLQTYPKSNSQKFTFGLGVVAIGLVFGLSIQFADAWTNPTSTPPAGNVAGPINTSNIAQTKAGAFTSNISLTSVDGGSGNGDLQMIASPGGLPAPNQATSYPTLKTSGTWIYFVTSAAGAPTYNGYYGNDGMHARAFLDFDDVTGTVDWFVDPMGISYVNRLYRTYGYETPEIDIQGLGAYYVDPSATSKFNIVSPTSLCFGVDCKTAWPGSQWDTLGNNIYNTNTGNVGIGTSAPNGKLTITTNAGGGMATYISMRYNDAAAADYTISRNGTTGHLEFNGNQTGYVGYGFNGSVGVGTASPISITGHGSTALNVADNGGGLLVLRHLSTTPGYRVGYLGFKDGILTYGRAADNGTGPAAYLTIEPDAHAVFGGRLTARSTFSSYTADGLFSASAQPSRIQTPGGQEIRFGYYDLGAGQYSPRIGYYQTGATTTGSNSSMGLLPDGNFTINAGASNAERIRIGTDGNVAITNSLCLSGDCRNAWPAGSGVEADTLQTVVSRGNTFSGALIDANNLNYYLNPDSYNYMATIRTDSILLSYPGYGGPGTDTGNDIVQSPEAHIFPGFVRNQGTGWNQSYYLGASTSYGLYSNTGMYFSGDVHGNAFFYHSDKILKKNISTVANPLTSVLSLHGVSFDWKETNEPSIGLIAQEVERVYPELVATDKMTGLKSVQYGNLVAPIIEAIREMNGKIEQALSRGLALEESVESQSARIEAQEKTIEELRGEINALKVKSQE